MLYITRKIGETVVINEHIRVFVVDVKGKKVKLGFEYPDGSLVLRDEIYKRIKDENRMAAESARLIQGEWE